jgi:outer membrane protein assembly factor BamB
MQTMLRLIVMIATMAGAAALSFSRDAERSGAERVAEQPPVAAQATFGNGPGRNMVNLVDKAVPTSWSVEKDRPVNLKWSADLGKQCFSGAVVHEGRVFVGTDNERPRDPALKGKKMAVLMCFAEKDGKFHWQNAHPQTNDDVSYDYGICGTPTVEGKFVYYCTPAAEVICAEVEKGAIAWKYDIMKELKVVPFWVCSCSPLVVGDSVYIVTGNGLGGEGKVAEPQAPSIIALTKKDGKLIWKNNMASPKVFEGQWSSAAYAEAEGKGQVIFAAGDGYVYGLDPKNGDMIWKFNGSPKKTANDRGGAPYFVATPVIVGSRVYIGVGSAPETGDPPRIGHFYCLDITKKGDVSCKNENFDPKDPANKESALVWHFGGMIQPKPAKGRAERIQGTISTASVADGLVYVAEMRGYVHCFDAASGERYWEHDFKSAEIWGSTYWVGGKFLVGTTEGEIAIFEHGKKYQAPRIVEMDEAIKTTPAMAGGVLYITTAHKLFAIHAGK